MKAPIDVQIIKQEGRPVFAVLPYDQYLKLTGQSTEPDIYIPHEVVGLCVEKEMSLLAAWRTYKGLSQSELAERMEITQPGVAQMERPGAKLQRRTVKKAARALGVHPEQLTE
jgi:DNA-binding XRE family transcriptional regulator